MQTVYYALVNQLIKTFLYIHTDSLCSSYNYRIVRNDGSKKFWWIWRISYKQFAKVFLPIFTAFNRIAYGFTSPMVKHMYGLLFMVSSIIHTSISTSSLQCCSYYQMYFYNKLSPVTFVMIQLSMILQLLYISSNYTMKTTLHCALATDGYSVHADHHRY